MLKSWRELLASPRPDDPLEGAGDISQENAPDKSDKRTNADLLRVDLSEVSLGQIEETSDKSIELPPQRLVRTGPNTWEEAAWARALCVFCEAPAVDVIACAEHRAKLDQTVMPWERD